MNRWLSLLGASGIASTTAVFIRSGAFPSTLPQALRSLAENLAAPGEFIWWATLGGPFNGRPSGFAGYLIWTLGSTLVWFALAYAFWVAVALVKRRLSGPSR